MTRPSKLCARFVDMKPVQSSHRHVANVAFKCGFADWKRTFQNIQHLKFTHIDTNTNLVDSIVIPDSSFVSEESDIQIDTPSNVDKSVEVCSEVTDETLFLRCLAQIYLKLQAKVFLPFTVIQTIVEHKKYMTYGVQKADIRTVIDVLKTEDLF